MQIPQLVVRFTQLAMNPLPQAWNKPSKPSGNPATTVRCVNEINRLCRLQNGRRRRRLCPVQVTSAFQLANIQELLDNVAPLAMGHPADRPARRLRRCGVEELRAHQLRQHILCQLFARQGSLLPSPEFIRLVLQRPDTETGEISVAKQPVQHRISVAPLLLTPQTPAVQMITARPMHKHHIQQPLRAVQGIWWDSVQLGHPQAVSQHARSSPARQQVPPILQGYPHGGVLTPGIGPGFWRRSQQRADQGIVCYP